VSVFLQLVNAFAYCIGDMKRAVDICITGIKHGAIRRIGASNPTRSARTRYSNGAVRLNSLEEGRGGVSQVGEITAPSDGV
jgi:hypothetical protein